MNIPLESSFNPLQIALGLSGVLLVVSVALVLYCTWRGPAVVDRILSLDLATGVALAVIVLLALQYKQEAFLDAAIALAVVGFMATAVFARRLEKGGDK